MAFRFRPVFYVGSGLHCIFIISNSQAKWIVCLSLIFVQYSELTVYISFIQLANSIGISPILFRLSFLRTEVVFMLFLKY